MMRTMSGEGEGGAGIGGEVYREAGRVIAGGRWRVAADDTVIYEPADGPPRASVIPAFTLRSDIRGWVRVE
uniref:hypothetical protein n=1 Tax=Actinokineospora sp. CA-119265 TaxID=3239890 RepID=UPI003F4905FB